MLNSLKNSYELFKVQLKWNSKSIAFWSTIGAYIVISTGISLMFGIIGLTNQRGELNSGTYDDMFLTIAIIPHIIMTAILISVFCVRVFVNNIKHRVVELEKNAGYNKMAIFFSRLMWLMTTIFSAIIANLLLSSIFFLILNKEGYSDFLYSIFIGMYGWEIVFALVYLLLFLVVLFLMGPTRASLLIIVILFLFNMSPILNITVKGNRARNNEIDWTVKKTLWFDDSKFDDDDTLNNLKKFYKSSWGYDVSSLGYEYAIRAKYNQINPEDFVPTKGLFDNLDKLTNCLNWSQDDIYLFSGNSENIKKNIYDVKDVWMSIDPKDIDAENKASFDVFSHYINELETFDITSEYGYKYYRFGYNIELNTLSQAYRNNPSMALISSLMGVIFFAHKDISQSMTYEKDGNKVVANSYKEFVNGNNDDYSEHGWYVEFNPTKSEMASMMLNPFTHISLMIKASTGLNAGIKEAIKYTNSNGQSVIYDKNIKITYNDDGSFKGYERIVHTEWLFVFYTFLAIGLLPLTYLMWRRKN